MWVRIFVFNLILLFVNSAYAREPMGMATGSETGTYAQFGQDIANISRPYGIHILPKTSTGSLDNIKRMSSKENVAFAIVQSDVLGYLSKSSIPAFKNHAKRLRLIYPFYNEEVHLFARKEIKQLKDLQGKKVVVGPKSSGTNMTAWNILSMTGVEPAQRINDSIDNGIKRVLKGTADAVFVVAGKPRKGFSNLFATPIESVKQLLQQVHFVPLDDKSLLAEYEKSDLNPQDYTFIKQHIPTIAVKSLLVSFDFSSGKTKYYKKRCSQLHTIAQAIRENIGKLRTGQYHKKWNQVNLDGDTKVWAVDKCSRGKQASPFVKPAKPRLDDTIGCVLTNEC